MRRHRRAIRPPHATDRYDLARMERTLDILLQHNAWATCELIGYCRCLSDDELDRPFEIGPGSVRKTLKHVVGAMQSWANRIGGEPVASTAPSPSNESIDELLRRCNAAQAALRAAAERVSREGRLDEIMTFQPPGHAEFHFTRASALVHVTTHGMHHRGQVFNMLRQLGKPIARDLDPIDWELATRDSTDA